jgi:hypothetical protein
LYSLDVPFRSETWYVAAEEPGQAVTQVGPILMALNQNRTVDIACTPGGRIRGRVEGVPRGWEGHVWVIAFSGAAVRTEVRVAQDGTFTLPPLPPGGYGLKAGHNAYEDPDVHPGGLMREHPESFKETGDPWKQAKVVKVETLLAKMSAWRRSNAGRFMVRPLSTSSHQPTAPGSTPLPSSHRATASRWPSVFWSLLLARR